MGVPLFNYFFLRVNFILCCWWAMAFFWRILQSYEICSASTWHKLRISSSLISFRTAPAAATPWVAWIILATLFLSMSHRLQLYDASSSAVQICWWWNDVSPWPVYMEMRHNMNTKHTTYIAAWRTSIAFVVSSGPGKKMFDSYQTNNNNENHRTAIRNVRMVNLYQICDYYPNHRGNIMCGMVHPYEMVETAP